MSVFQSVKPFVVRSWWCSQPSPLLGGGHGRSFRRIMTIHLLGIALSRHILCSTVMSVFQSVKPFAVRSWWCSQPSPPLGDGHGICSRRIMTIHLLDSVPSRHILCGTVMVVIPAVTPYAERPYGETVPSREILCGTVMVVFPTVTPFVGRSCETWRMLSTPIWMPAE